ncbi:MAG: hypothetical protein QM755_12220 [Luteolibacter sp.]
MLNIPNDTLAKILELRSKNGLEATPEALEASLEAAKCKWTLEDTPRYRRAGDAPIYISGKYLTQAGVCPATGEKDAGSGIKRPAAKSETSRSAAVTTAPSQETFYRVLHGKGFNVRITKDLLTGEIREEVPREISELDLQFGALPPRAEGIHVTQTTPQIQISMSLDKFLELARIKP